VEAARVESPFVGLVPYTEQDARFFFGREREQRVIIANLFASRLTILYGASGVGKSSVLRAGVVTGIEERAAQARASGEPPGAAVVYFNHWQGDILSRLSDAVRAAVAAVHPTLPSGNGPGPSDLSGFLGAAAERLERDLLIILDQFEEYFLYHPQDPGEESFAHQFAQAANASMLPASFLISLRDDALSRLDRFKLLIPNLFSNYLRLDPLSAELARRAITEPLAAYNRLPSARRVEGAPMEIEAELVDAVIAQVPAGRAILSDAGQGAAPSARQAGIEAPYLQLVMQRLWKEEVEKKSGRLRWKTLEDLKGAEAIVKSHLDEALSGMSNEEREICARMFQFLVTESGTKIAHTAPDLAFYAGVSASALQPLLEQLAGKVRILAPVAPPRDRPDLMRYEIYHDSLGRAVLDWRRRYVAKQEESERRAEDERKQREVETAQALAEAQRAAAQQAEALAEQRRRAALRLRWMLGALAVLFAAAVYLVILSWNQRKQLAEQTSKYAALLSSPVTRGPEIAGTAGKYVLIRAGTFLMGCSLGDTECDSDEKRTHKVTLSRDFYMGTTEVTVRAYRRFAQETKRGTPQTPSFSQTDDHPVVNVSWDEASAYCTWDGGGRLPTEAQWEYAARAGSSQARYGDLDAIAWYDKNSGGSTHPVGQKIPNAFGLHDMLGNVWEWCSDWFDEKYYDKSQLQDPQGPPTGVYRSARGGSWYFDARNARASSRGWGRPVVRNYVVGFRCVREVP
jgi:formylglycine-generating enzyme required for sulfatase activity